MDVIKGKKGEGWAKTLLIKTSMKQNGNYRRIGIVPTRHIALEGNQYFLSRRNALDFVIEIIKSYTSVLTLLIFLYI